MPVVNLPDCGPPSPILETLGLPILDKSEMLICSPVDSRASRFPLPGSEEARAIAVTSGRQCLMQSTLSGPLGLLVKMLLESPTWFSTKSCLVWKRQAISQRRSLFRLVPLELCTKESGFGILAYSSSRRLQGELRQDCSDSAGTLEAFSPCSIPSGEEQLPQPFTVRSLNGIPDAANRIRAAGQRHRPSSRLPNPLCYQRSPTDGGFSP